MSDERRRDLLSGGGTESGRVSLLLESVRGRRCNNYWWWLGGEHRLLLLMLQ